LSDDAILGDDGGDQVDWCDVERWVVHGRPGLCDVCARDLEHLAGRPFLDGYLAAMGRGEVNRRLGCDDDERNAVTRRGQR